MLNYSIIGVNIKGKPSLSLFFHHFKVQRSLATHMWDHGLINLVQVVSSFKMFLEILKHFENRFSLAMSLRPKAHAIVCIVGSEVRDMCTDIFPKY